MAITESSLVKVSYGAIVVIATSVIGFTLWLSAINEKAQANALHIKELREDRKIEIELLRDVRGRVAKIEGYLEAMVPKKGDK